MKKLLKDSERNNSIRKDLIERFAGQLMTDDERAELFGLPKGCRIRRTLKSSLQKIFSVENMFG